MFDRKKIIYKKKLKFPIFGTEGKFEKLKKTEGSKTIRAARRRRIIFFGIFSKQFLIFQKFLKVQNFGT